MDLKQILKSRFTTFVLGLVLVLIMVTTAQVLIRKYEVDRQIANLEERAEEINRKNLELSELVKYLNTPEYKEREARERLNLKKEGEIVLAVPDQLKESDSQSAAPLEPSNPEKWFNYFFAQ
jgi:cell division protein FtsB